MLSGSLNKFIDIEVLTKAVDALGTPVNTWASLETNVRASARPSVGNKRFDRDTEGDIHSFNTTFIFRDITGFGYDCRIIYKTNVYEILSIQEYGYSSACRTEGWSVVARRMINNG